MALNLSERFSRGRDLITSAQPSKLLIGGLVLAAATAVLLVALLSNRDGPTDILYSNLSPQDANAITMELKKQGIPYTLSSDGRIIEMPSDKVPEIRLNLAVMGLPSSGNVGFEIFDEQKLGVTDTVQKTNLMRAVSGELERTIKQMPEIEGVRVHLSVPRETLFIEEQDDPAASVMVTLRGGAELEKPQIMGIVHLVVSAVNGLKPESVSIIDSNGGLIWSKDSSKPGFLNDDQMKQKQAYEENIRRRIQAMMERVVGPNRASTTVNAELDLKEVVTQEDIYDPERTAVRSEQRIQERSQGPGRAMAGIPNATYELGTANRQNSGAGGNQEVYSRTEETSNYEITTIKRQTVSAAGDLKKISVAVLLDGLYSQNETGETVFTPLPQELLTQLEESIKSTIGFDASRGDSVSVISVQLASRSGEEISAWAPFIVDLLREFARPFLNLILIILFFFFVVRPIIKWLKKEVEPVGGGAEPAILPEYPSSGPSFGLGLPLPEAPQGALGVNLARQEIGDLSPAGDTDEDINLDLEDARAPSYDDVQPEESAPAQLAYGNLNRENVLPLARDNMERTIGLIRDWIEQKPSPDSGR